MKHWEFITPRLQYGPPGVLSVTQMGEGIRCVDADEVQFGESHVKFINHPIGTDPAYTRSKLVFAIQHERVLEICPVEQCTQTIDTKYGEALLGPV